MKKILGLDLGTTSIGWALVKEAQYKNEKSSIIKTGVRVIPITTDERNDFESGKSISINADRTLKRGARRNLQRYHQRRDTLIKLFKKNNIINDKTILAEDGKNMTHSLWKLRATAATKKITLVDFARVLLSINKKRGYKSNRKAIEEGDGKAIDSIDVTKEIYKKKMTPGQYIYNRLMKGNLHIPEFYRSDLQAEFDKIWEFQRKYYPKVLTKEFKKQLQGKNASSSGSIFFAKYKISTAENKGNRNALNLQYYKWRSEAIHKKLTIEETAYVLCQLNGNINNSSSYLGAISDRSKELYFNNQTIGQFLYNQLLENPHTRLKNQVFYRQDYMDEFERIWEKQSKFYKNILTDKLKKEIRDSIIFYQRRLKSQKGLISICEFERKEIEVDIKGMKKIKTIGPRVIPKSSPLFQEFRIWQMLNNLEFTNIHDKEHYSIADLDDDVSIRNQLFEELNTRDKLTEQQILKQVLKNPKNWSLNYKDGIDGNTTNKLLYKAYRTIVELSGHDVINIKKMSSEAVKETLSEVFDTLGIKKEILDFDPNLKGKDFEQQLSYQLWHLLYSYEGDNSNTGNDKLIEKLNEKFGFSQEYAQLFVNIAFQPGYGSLSAKAIKEILKYLKEGNKYSEACMHAGYDHSHSMTKEENEKRVLHDTLKLLPKNSLRNPIVEKILNQMVNVVNAVIEKYGKPDEIRIELARELKKNAKERKEMTDRILKATKEHEKIKEKIAQLAPFNNGTRITRNDIVKYKLYEELSGNGYKTLYSNKYIPREKLFTKEFDIEHIIPKALLFDDSFSNKTLATRQINLEKSNETAYDYMEEKYSTTSENFNNYLLRVKKLHNENNIGTAKYKKLLMKGSEIPDGFIDRDLRNSQYIAKKASQMLFEIVKTVTPTTGSITAKLRRHWQLINIMQELNWGKYDKLGLTKYNKNKEGKKIPEILDWTKRNDHRHHAMDALTVAFTKPSIIQYYNHLNARKNEGHKKHKIIFAIEQKETFVNDNKTRIVKPPIPIGQFRKEAKKHLENILVSFKAKNKVVTKNINKSKKRSGYNSKLELTPRGQLHKETVYGKSKYYETQFQKVGPKFDVETINHVAKKKYREALLNRLNEFDNDPKKAFSGKNTLTKNPVYLDEHQSVKLPEKIKLVYLTDRYTIRKNITDIEKLDKIVDIKTRNILKERVIEFDGDSKKAFSNLDEKPVWLNENKGIKLKRITITGVNNAEPLHYKKDHNGQKIMDKEGNPIPVDFVSTGNNHHVAIYRDEEGNLHEKVVSFYEAVIAKNNNLPVIDKNFNAHLGWKFLFTMKQNEYFVFPNEDTGFDPNTVDLLNVKNYYIISPNLYRVQKIATKNYFFRHHLETKIDKGLENITYKNIRSANKLKAIVKVRINHLGEIVRTGEY